MEESGSTRLLLEAASPRTEEITGRKSKEAANLHVRSFNKRFLLIVRALCKFSLIILNWVISKMLLFSFLPSRNKTPTFALT